MPNQLFRFLCYFEIILFVNTDKIKRYVVKIRTFCGLRFFVFINETYETTLKKKKKKLNEIWHKVVFRVFNVNLHV